MMIPGAPVHLLDCCDAQEFHIGHQGFICFDKIPGVRETADSTSIMGKCRFCEKTIEVRLNRPTDTWIVRWYPPS
jgi:hypothetical protein